MVATLGINFRTQATNAVNPSVEMADPVIWTQRQRPINQRNVNTVYILRGRWIGVDPDARLQLADELPTGCADSAE